MLFRMVSRSARWSCRVLLDHLHRRCRYGQRPPKRLRRRARTGGDLLLLHGTLFVGDLAGWTSGRSIHRATPESSSATSSGSLDDLDAVLADPTVSRARAGSVLVGGRSGVNLRGTMSRRSGPWHDDDAAVVERDRQIRSLRLRSIGMLGGGVVRQTGAAGPRTGSRGPAPTTALPDRAVRLVVVAWDRSPPREPQNGTIQIYDAAGRRRCGFRHRPRDRLRAGYERFRQRSLHSEPDGCDTFPRSMRLAPPP